MRKPRGDSKLKTMPAAWQGELYARANSGTGAEALAWLAKEHGVQSSPAALTAFVQWYPLTRRLEQAADFADHLKEQLANLPEWQGRAAELEKLAQVAFETQAVRDQDPELYVALKKRRQKDAELALAESKHSLALKQYEEKIAAARASLEKAKSKGGLSKDTLKLIEEQLKLL